LKVQDLTAKLAINGCVPLDASVTGELPTITFPYDKFDVTVYVVAPHNHTLNRAVAAHNNVYLVLDVDAAVAPVVAHILAFVVLEPV